MDLCRRKQLTHNLQVHIVVIYHKNMCIRRLEALSVTFPLMGMGPGSKGKCSKLLIIYNILLQHDDKCRPLGIYAVDADLAAHQFH